MLPGIAENLDDDVRSAVDHLRVIGEVRRRIDEAAGSHAAHDFVEIATQRGADLRDDVEGAKPGCDPAVMPI